MPGEVGRQQNSNTHVAKFQCLETDFCIKSCTRCKASDPVLSINIYLESQIPQVLICYCSLKELCGNLKIQNSLEDDSNISTMYLNYTFHINVMYNLLSTWVDDIQFFCILSSSTKKYVTRGKKATPHQLLMADIATSRSTICN